MDKRGNTIRLVPNAAQAKYFTSVEQNPWLYVLKARQLGLTTIIAAHNFWKTLFTSNHRVLVMAHTHVAAETIFKIYRRFYDNLPQVFRFPLDAANVRELAFSHGGVIKVSSAGSGSARGATYNAIHCSEFAFYKDIPGTIAAAFQTASDNASIVLETTANGINEAHKMWFAQDGYDKLFIGWTHDTGYISKKRPKHIPSVLADYKEKYELTDHQYWWAVQTFLTKCASSYNTFRQEYPITPEQAFVTTGSRFFVQLYPNAQPSEGYKQYQQPTPYRIYSLGADTASGSALGDYSAFCVLDVTDKVHPEIVSTFYDRVSPSVFAGKVLEEVKKYNALAVVESNSYGLSILEHLTKSEWGFLYRRTKYDKLENRWTEQLGFNTSSSTRALMLSRLQEYLTNGWLDPKDPNLQYEMNTFIFNDAGKPIASSGKHDDMVFAAGLALMGLDQIDEVKEEQIRRKPTNIGEILQFELSTGNLYSEVKDEFFPDDERQDQNPSSLL